MPIAIGTDALSALSVAKTMSVDSRPLVNKNNEGFNATGDEQVTQIVVSNSRNPNLAERFGQGHATLNDLEHLIAGLHGPAFLAHEEIDQLELSHRPGGRFQTLPDNLAADWPQILTLAK